MTTLIVPSSYASIVFSRSKVSVNLNAGCTGTIKDHTAITTRNAAMVTRTIDNGVNGNRRCGMAVLYPAFAITCYTAHMQIAGKSAACDGQILDDCSIAYQPKD